MPKCSYAVVNTAHASPSPLVARTALDTALLTTFSCSKPCAAYHPRPTPTLPQSLACLQHLSGLEQYFAMARGAEGCTALDMSKYFDSNYHFLVRQVEFTHEITW